MTSDALSNESNRESNGAAGSTANRNVSIDPAAFAWVRCLTQRVELGCPDRILSVSSGWFGASGTRRRFVRCCGGRSVVVGSGSDLAEEPAVGM